MKRLFLTAVALLTLATVPAGMAEDAPENEQVLDQLKGWWQGVRTKIQTELHESKPLGRTVRLAFAIGKGSERREFSVSTATRRCHVHSDAAGDGGSFAFTAQCALFPVEDDDRILLVCEIEVMDEGQEGKQQFSLRTSAVATPGTPLQLGTFEGTIIGVTLQPIEP